MSQPKLSQIGVTVSRGGKVALREYGKHTSDYFASFTRTYSIPDDWSNEDAEVFQVREYDRLVELADPLDEYEYVLRYNQSEMKVADPN